MRENVQQVLAQLLVRDVVRGQHVPLGREQLRCCERLAVDEVRLVAREADVRERHAAHDHLHRVLEEVVVRPYAGAHRDASRLSHGDLGLDRIRDGFVHRVNSRA